MSSEMLEGFLRALESRGSRISRSGSGRQAQCPAHEDRRASLSVSMGDKGVLFNCHAGCSKPDILAALDLSWGDVFIAQDGRTGRSELGGDLWMPCQADTENPCSGHKAAEYRYTDERGNLLFATCRCSRKSDGCVRPFAQWRPDDTAKNGKRWNLQNVRRVIYRLPEVLAAIPDRRRIWITEGEKDADLLRSKGEVATSAPMGAGSWLTEYARYFRGAVAVVVVADCDEPGLAHAETVYRSVSQFVDNVKVVCTPLREKGSDATDHFEYGLGLEDFEVVPFEPVERRPRMAIEVEARHREAPVHFAGFSQAAVERSLVGAMLRFGQGYQMAASDIVSDDRLALAAQAAVKLAARNTTITAEMVAAQIEEMGNGSYEKVLAFLREVERAAFSDLDKTQRAARILRERSMRREIAYMCRAVEEALKDERRTIEEVLATLRRMAESQAEQFARLDEYCAPVGDVFAEDMVEEVRQESARRLQSVVTDAEIAEALDAAEARPVRNLGLVQGAG